MNFTNILLLFGVYLTGLGLFFILQNMKNKLEEVKLEVVAFEKREDHKSNEINVPVYKVFAGEYQGITKVCRYNEGDIAKKLNVGDLIDGFIALPNKDLISKDSVPIKKWMPIWLLVIGIGIVFVCLYLK